MSRELDVLRARVHALQTQTATVDADMRRMASDEISFARSHGERETGVLHRVLLSPVYVITASAVQLFPGLTDWSSFDHQWAGRLMVRIQSLRVALERFEQLNGVAYPPSEEREVQGLLLQGNQSARRAAQLHNTWMRTSASRYDTLNRSWTSRWFQRLVLEGNTIVVWRAAHTGSTVAQQAGSWTSGAEAAGRAVAAVTTGVRPPTTAELLAQQDEDQQNRDRPAGNFPAYLTVGLIVVGGAIAIGIVRELGKN